MNKEEYYTATELLEVLNVSRATVYRWTVKGRLPHLLTPSKQFVYKKSDIEEFKKHYPMTAK